VVLSNHYPLSTSHYFEEILIMKLIVNVEANRDELNLILSIIKDSVYYANSRDTIRVYMRDNDPNGVVVEEHYDENENLIARREH
jgi:hypothetical protein